MKYVIVGTGNISGTYADVLPSVTVCEVAGFISCHFSEDSMVVF